MPFFEMSQNLSKTTRHSYKISNILTVTDLQQSVANKSCKQAYATRIITR